MRKECRAIVLIVRSADHAVAFSSGVSRSETWMMDGCDGKALRKSFSLVCRASGKAS